MFFFANQIQLCSGCRLKMAYVLLPLVNIAKAIKKTFWDSVSLTPCIQSFLSKEQTNKGLKKESQILKTKVPIRYNMEDLCYNFLHL